MRLLTVALLVLQGASERPHIWSRYPSPEAPQARAERLAANLDDRGSRVEAFAELTQMHAKAAPAIPRLLCLLEEETDDYWVPHGGASDLLAARDALAAIGTASIGPILDVLSAPCGTPVGRTSRGKPCHAYLAPHVESPAERALGCRVRDGLLVEALALQGVSAVPNLTDCVSSRRLAPATACANALAAIGPDAKDALPALREKTLHPDLPFRAAAKRAVVAIDK